MAGSTDLRLELLVLLLFLLLVLIYLFLCFAFGILHSLGAVCNEILSGVSSIEVASVIMTYIL